ncbi:MAG: peptidase M14 [bacterium]|nr:peptidase M14 [bacterium]
MDTRTRPVSLFVIMRTLLVVLLVGCCSQANAASLQAVAEVPDPQFNRLYPNDEIVEFLRGYAKAFPEWVRLESIGKASAGGDMWVLSINNPETGPELSKPAMYVDGATHANEVQGTETALYLINYLLHNYGELDPVTELMDRAVFYFVPMVNPDSREKWFTEPSTASFPRTVPVHIDDDRDGRIDEDGMEDLDGDGELTQMRKRVPLGEGDYKLHPDDPRRLVEVEDDELGDYIRLGSEGIDNDGDGRVNEDSIGYVDPNRTWGYGWQPRYVQNGTTQYPLQIAESRSIALWALEHPNVIAAQSFHNTGQMILRGPGSKMARRYERVDVRAYDIIGEEGEKLLPGYKYMVLWKDLYTAYGGTLDHFYGIHGAITFSNELWGPVQDFDGDGDVTEEERFKFSDLLTHGRMFSEWTEFDHPQYGTVEIGGFRHDTWRVPEGWMLEEECHRNASFVFYHATQLPKLRFGEPIVEHIDGKLWRIHVPVRNDRAIPSMTAVASQLKLHRPDIVTVEGAQVISSGVVQDAYLNKVDLQKHRPERLMVDGVEGRSTKTLFLLVEGSGDITVTYDSVKAGTLTKTIELE